MLSIVSSCLKIFWSSHDYILHHLIVDIVFNTSATTLLWLGLSDVLRHIWSWDHCCKTAGVYIYCRICSRVIWSSYGAHLQSSTGQWIFVRLWSPVNRESETIYFRFYFYHLRVYLLADLWIDNCLDKSRSQPIAFKINNLFDLSFCQNLVHIRNFLDQILRLAIRIWGSSRVSFAQFIALCCLSPSIFCNYSWNG